MQIHVKTMPLTRYKQLIIRDPRLIAWSDIKKKTRDYSIIHPFEGPRWVFTEILETVARERRQSEALGEDESDAGKGEPTGSAYGVTDG